MDSIANFQFSIHAHEIHTMEELIMIFFQCPLVRIEGSVVKQDKNATLVVQTQWAMTIAIVQSNASHSTMNDTPNQVCRQVD